MLECIEVHKKDRDSECEIITDIISPTLSALPVAKMNSEYGLKERQLTSAVWASTVCEGLLVLLARVSQIISFWSSATDPNRDSWRRCHATSWYRNV